MKVGDKVEGVLFPLGKVVALGTAESLRKYDLSGACTEMEPTTPCVAVETLNGVAVYVQDEVWEVLP